jgi:hypothetical protein
MVIVVFLDVIKSLFSMMKKLVYAILLLIVCVSCKKTEESPDLSLLIQGIYRLNFLQINRQDIITSATSTTSGTVNVTRNDKDAVNITVVLTDPSGSRSFPLGKFTLKDEIGNNTVSIYDAGNASVGTGNSSLINFNVTLGPTSFAFRGVK